MATKQMTYKFNRTLNGPKGTKVIVCDTESGYSFKVPAPKDFVKAEVRSIVIKATEEGPDGTPINPVFVKAIRG